MTCRALDAATRTRDQRLIELVIAVPRAVRSLSMSEAVHHVASRSWSLTAAGDGVGT